MLDYSFVMNDKKEYNLIDGNEKLLTQWFNAIKPLQQPYGKYQIIAYINADGYFCALGYDGKVYNMNKTWKEMCAENRHLLNTSIFISIITEQIDKNMISAARTLGLSETTIFFKVAIPLAWPGIIGGLVLSFARALGEFGATLMIAGNIPGKTQTMPVAIFFAVESGDMNKAMLWVLIIVAISFIMIFLLNYWCDTQQKLIGNRGR